MMNDWGYSFGMGYGMGPFGLLIFAVILVLPFWFISQKAGYSPWLSLLMLIPVANVLFLYFLAFSEWPTREKTPAAA